MTSGTHIDVEDLVALRARSRQIGRQRTAESTVSAGARSAFRGRGVDFETSRPYEIGDDVRAIDWRVTARRGTAHTKVFKEERERPVLLLVDVSAAMTFGTRRMFKSVLAARAAALLAWGTVDSGDRVGGLVVNDTHIERLAPRSRSEGALIFCTALARHQTREYGSAPATTKFNEALIHLAQHTTAGGAAFVLSDFRTLDEDGIHALTRLGQRSELIMGVVYDPLEAAIPKAGDYLFSFAGQRRVLRIRNEQERDTYQARFSAHLGQLARVSTAASSRLLTLNTGDAGAEAAPRALLR